MTFCPFSSLFSPPCRFPSLHLSTVSFSLPCPGGHFPKISQWTSGSNNDNDHDDGDGDDDDDDDDDERYYIAYIDVYVFILVSQRPLPSRVDGLKIIALRVLGALAANPHGSTNPGSITHGGQPSRRGAAGTLSRPVCPRGTQDPSAISNC